jgi:hypothetical protein
MKNFKQLTVNKFIHREKKKKKNPSIYPYDYFC